MQSVESLGFFIKYIGLVFAYVSKKKLLLFINIDFFLFRLIKKVISLKIEQIELQVVIYRIHYLISGRNRIRIFFLINIRPEPDPDFIFKLISGFLNILSFM